MKDSNGTVPKAYMTTLATTEDKGESIGARNIIIENQLLSQKSFRVNYF